MATLKKWFFPTVRTLRRASTLSGSGPLPVIRSRSVAYPFLKPTFGTKYRTLCMPRTEVSIAPDPVREPARIQCAGCGATLQSSKDSQPGFIPKSKLEKWQADFQTLSTAEDEPEIKSEPLICQRCFSLKHYNTALNITLKADDYLAYLGSLKDKRALILLMVDVTDFPTSLFPNLNTLISDTSRVMIVANKSDLLPKETSRRFWKDFEQSILSDGSNSLTGCNVMGVHFISAKTEQGLEELCDQITYSWGNRGDVYLLGCTNVGKSTLFNKLLTRLCGARPGELRTEGSPNVPMATISQWPGTTLGLLSFPLLSVGKIRRLKQQREKLEREQQLQHSFYEDDSLKEVAFDEENILNPREAKRAKQEATDIDDVLEELGIGRNRKKGVGDPLPLNKYWLHDTPGAINDAQLINLLTTKELKLALPKKPLKPRTFILKPGQCLFIGGLARLDYTQGPDSAYFTVFAASYLPVHTSKVSKADTVYQNLLGTSVLKIPVSDPEDRLSSFPPLLSQDIHVQGESWKRSAADIVLSSAGWISFTIGTGMEATLTAYTPLGRGLVVRQPSLYPLAVNERGKRSRSGNRTEFRGK